MLLCRLWQRVSLLSEITALKVPFYPSTFLIKSRTCKTKAAALAFTLQNRESFSSLIAEEPNCSLEGSLPEAGLRVIGWRDKGEEGVQPDFQTLSLCEPHGALGKCSPGRKEHSSSKTNTKLEYFLLYFSYRSFVIQKRFEERAIIKPLMCY